MKNLIFILIFQYLCILPFITGKYNDQWARKLFSLSAAAFANDPRICVQKEFGGNDWSVIKKFKAVYNKHSLEIRAFAIRNDLKKEIILSYAVLEPIDENSLETLIKYAQPVSFLEYGQVQSIFFELEEQIWDFTHSIVTFEDLADYSVTFTGYSLAGGIATLSAMKSIFYQHRKSSYVQLVTFAEPRIGTLVFSTSVDREIPQKFRITHSGDPVVHLPKCITRNGGCTVNEPQSPTHHGTEIFYNNTMYFGADFIRCTASDEDEKCSNSRQNSLDFTDHIYYFQHKVISYGLFDCTDVEGTQHKSNSSSIISIVSIIFVFIFKLLF